MKALILLGGLGTRLRPLTLDCPKPLLPILNRPFLSYQIDLLKKFGVRDVVLALGHKAAHFRRRLGDGRTWGVRFAYSVETEPLGTGGAIRRALDHVTDRVVILNGDVLSDFDLSRISSQHERLRAQGTLALVEVKDPSAYGLVETRADGVITRFLEKPSGDVFPCRTINAGCYLFERSVIERIPAGRAVSIEREIFPSLLADNVTLGGFLHSGYWSDIGSLPSYWGTHRDLHAAGRWPKGVRVRGGARLEPGAALHRTARVRDTALIGRRARVGAGVELVGHVTLGPNVSVSEGARLADCVVLEGAVIGARARVDGAVVGRRVRLGADVVVGPGQVLGTGSVLSDHSRAGSGPLGF